MQDLDLAGLVGVCIAQLRKRFPEIDGFYVFLIALAISVLFSFMRDPESWRTTMLPRAFAIFSVVMGGYSVVGYGAEKMGQHIVAGQADQAPNTEGRRS